jgi:ABC-type xylose transport system permease subunit
MKLKLRFTWDTSILLILAGVWISASLTTDNFLSSINVSQIFSNTSEITIMAFGVIFLIILVQSFVHLPLLLIAHPSIMSPFNIKVSISFSSKNFNILSVCD